MFQTKEPRLESASRDDRSSKHQPKRVERGRERSLGERRHAFAAQVTKTVWTRFLEREAADEAVVDARCVHAINDEELVHEVVRKAPNGKTASALCYSRLARYDHPLERAVVKTYSVDCEGCDEAGNGRLEFPLTGYVVDQVGDAYCMVSFALDDGTYLRSNLIGELRAHRPDESARFRLDATFYAERDRFYPGSVSFHSVNYNGFYISHGSRFVLKTYYCCDEPDPVSYTHLTLPTILLV